MGKFIDLTGQKFGRLTVLEKTEKSKYGKTQWLCQWNIGKHGWRKNMGKNKSNRRAKTELAQRTSVLRKLDNMMKKDGKHHGKKEKSNA